MKIGVIGSGAIGLYYGSKLQKSGQDAHFLIRRDYQAVADKGLFVHSIRGDLSLATGQRLADSRRNRSG